MISFSGCVGATLAVALMVRAMARIARGVGATARVARTVFDIFVCGKSNVLLFLGSYEVQNNQNCRPFDPFRSPEQLHCRPQNGQARTIAS